MGEGQFFIQKDRLRIMTEEQKIVGSPQRGSALRKRKNQENLHHLGLAGLREPPGDVSGDEVGVWKVPPGIPSLVAVLLPLQERDHRGKRFVAL